MNVLLIMFVFSGNFEFETELLHTDDASLLRSE